MHVYKIPMNGTYRCVYIFSRIHKFCIRTNMTIHEAELSLAL